MSAVDFEITDIEYFETHVFFDKVEFETLHNKLKSLSRGSFLSNAIASESFYQFAEQHIPSLRLVGNGFQIQVFANSIILIVASRYTPNQFATPRDTPVSPKKLFAKENFQKLSVDFNAVVGQILGILNIDHTTTKFMVRIRLKKDDVGYQTNRFDEKTNPILQSLLGESIETQFASIAFKTKEVFLNMPVNTVYHLIKSGSLYDDQINEAVFLGRFSFENTGTQDLNMILEEYMKRINDVVKKLTGGLSMNE